MRIDILTLFPEMFVGPLDESIVRRAREKSLVEIKIHNLRDWAIDKHATVDDKPYGGGPGMVLRVDVLDKALSDLTSKKKAWVVLLSPQGKTFNQQKAQELSKLDHIVLIAGHYEGFDERIKDLVDEELSIGDFVLTGGEIPAMAIVDSIVRLLPGALGDKESLKDETHITPGHIKYPVYTRPEEYKGKKVPEVLLSGDHKKIEAWRRENSKKTKLTDQVSQPKVG